MLHRGKAMTKKNGKKISKTTANQADNQQHIKDKWRAAVKKASEIQKTLRAKMAAMKAEHQQKLQQVEQQAYEKARADFEENYVKKTQAKEKILQAAAEKFEKSYASQMKKLTKGHKKTFVANKTASSKTHKKLTTKARPNTTKRRGRPPKYLNA